MTEPDTHTTLLTDDEHDRALLANVHPQWWEQPEGAGRYHLVVVGGGTAGLVSAAGAAGLGARVALIERNLLGGDCLNVGCVPSKAIIGAARAWHESKRAAEFGAPLGRGDGDFAKAMERMRRLRAKISPNDSAERFRELGIDVFFGHARFTGRNTLEVGDTELRFRRAVIATGARAAAPPIPGLAENGYLTNETVFRLTERPERLAVIGAGPIGCELAQAFARMGVAVTILDAGDRILPRAEADAAQIVLRSLERDGVHYAPSVRLTKVERGALRKIIHFEVGGVTTSLGVDEILVAAGRRPNVDDLGLEEAGVEYYAATGIEVNERLRTANRRIYAAGDVASAYQFTHAADAMARIVIRNALFFGSERADRLVIPWCTYTSPEVAGVGLNAEEAERREIEIDTVTVPLGEVDRAILDDAGDGYLTVHVLKGTDRIAGATLVAPRAGDMIGELVLAMTAEVGLERIASTIHPYPTQGEIVKKAADAWRRTKLTPRAKRVLDRYFRILR